MFLGYLFCWWCCWLRWQRGGLVCGLGERALVVTVAGLWTIYCPPTLLPTARWPHPPLGLSAGASALRQQQQRHPQRLRQPTLDMSVAAMAHSPMASQRHRLLNNHPVQPASRAGRRASYKAAGLSKLPAS